MTTFHYLKSGPMHSRPYHLIGEPGISLCGKVRQGEAGVASVNVAPLPVTLEFVCVECRAALAKNLEDAVELV